MINEQMNDKVVALEVQTYRLTAGVLKNAMRAYLDRNNQNKHGKMQLKQLLRKDQTVKSIEITDKNIKSFEKVAKKYGIDYALKKDESAEPPKYIVFFKARDADVLEQAFKEYTNDVLQNKDKQRVSVKEKLKNFREKVKSQTRQREKTHKREQSL